MSEKKEKKRLIVVLGMHRSGTSAITCGLQVLGAEPGERLMIPIVGNNDKGFFEDVDVNALNIEMLEAVGNYWSNISPISNSDIQLLNNNGFFLRAVDLLRAKISAYEVFLLKDPRITKLLPFWSAVFMHMDINLTYVLAIRNPLSVARSLLIRDGIVAEHAYYLWLAHVLEVLKIDDCVQKIVVNYDRLIESPEAELQRLAKFTGLMIDINKLESFKNQFLDEKLRHTKYSKNDLLVDLSCPTMIYELYGLLDELSIMDQSFSIESIQGSVNSLIGEFGRLQPALKLVDNLNLEILNKNNEVVRVNNEWAIAMNIIKDLETRLLNAEKDNDSIKSECSDQIQKLISKHKDEFLQVGDKLSMCESKVDGLNEAIKALHYERNSIKNTLFHSAKLGLSLLKNIFRSKILSCKYRLATIINRLRIRGKNKEPIVDGVLDISILPNDFNSALYLKFNPDVMNSGVDAQYHYINFGRFEGRQYKSIELVGDESFDASKEVILLLTHEASRTGAPVLSYNIVKELTMRYNVITLMLGAGPLIDDFLFQGSAYVVGTEIKNSKPIADFVLSDLNNRFNFKFAIVNSIESRYVLDILSNISIPAITLIHEFASYTRPIDAFPSALFWSSEVVFSAQIVRDNAFANFPHLRARATHIIPQGRCRLPGGGLSDQTSMDRDKLRKLVRPMHLDANVKIVLGAGFVQMRKGVDLFIESATRVLAMNMNNKIRFVWVGKGYDPDDDTGYSVYLKDQIARAGLSDVFAFIHETPLIEVAYEEADLFLLSSRLDPLPNVAIEVMSYGVPIVCFDKTTGIVDFLKDIGLEKICVADYIDTTDMARKITQLLNSKSIYDDASSKCKKFVASYFDMASYVTKLETLASKACAEMHQRMDDQDTIISSGLFNPDFGVSNKSSIPKSNIEVYLQSWKSMLGRRKPYPGFHPGIYAEQHGLTSVGSDPFADYLRANKPDGIWRYPVIKYNSQKLAGFSPDDMKVALHIHAYYPDLLRPIMKALECNKIRPDLFVSVCDEHARREVLKELICFDYVYDVRVVPNRGRDIGPLLTEFGSEISKSYEFIGHIHTKKSLDISDALVGSSWLNFLIVNLLGETGMPMADQVLYEFTLNPNFGIVFPDDPNVVGWDSNKDFANKIADKMGMDKLPDNILFPVGSMFWARVDALSSIFGLNLNWDDYPDEPLPYDGSVLHALERLLGFPSSGYQLATTYVPEVLR